MKNEKVKIKKQKSKKKKRKPKARVLKVVLKVLVVFVAVLVGIAATIGILYGAYFLTSRPTNHSVKVVIEPGLTTDQISRILVQKGVVDSSFFFTVYVKQQGAESKLQAGEYILKTGLSYREALRALLKGPKIRYYKVTVPEGLTVKEIAKRMVEKTPIKEEDFLAAAKKSDYSYSFLVDVPTDSLEGFLFPKTYVVTSRMDAHDVIDRMLFQFQKEISPLDFGEAKGKNLNLYQIVIIASMIEEEVKLSDERDKVAAVIYNRLARGMLLEMCSTVQYVLLERKDQLTYEDLRVESPYNTYLHLGLPPGPICSPGLASMEAALKPAPVDYLYFVLTSPEGRHTFTNSAEEFERIKREQGL